jgi:hypothetical protein
MPSSMECVKGSSSLPPAHLSTTYSFNTWSRTLSGQSFTFNNIFRYLSRAFACASPPMEPSIRPDHEALYASIFMLAAARELINETLLGEERVEREQHDRILSGDRERQLVSAFSTILQTSNDCADGAAVGLEEHRDGVLKLRLALDSDKYSPKARHALERMGKVLTSILGPRSRWYFELSITYTVLMLHCSPPECTSREATPS